MDTTTLTYLANTTEDMQGNLRIRQTDESNKTDTNESSGLAVSADTVSISEEGKRLSGQAVQKVEESDETDTETSLTEQRIERLQKRIQEIQEEIKEIQADDKLTDKQKQQKIQALTAELLQIQQELNKLKRGGGVPAGGTPAEGSASSLT